MTVITTAEYWDVDGSNLNNLAYNIETLTGRLSVPSLRGGNRTIPYRRGQDWRQKVADSRQLTLAMWLQGSDDNGAEAAAYSDRVEQWNANFDALVRLFYRSDRQINLTKRWRDQASGTVLSATAKAEYVSGLEPAMASRLFARVGVTVFLSDPWFYGDVINENIPLIGVPTVENPGHEQADGFGMSIVFNGPLTSPRLTNNDYGIWVDYDDVVASGKTVTLDIDKFTATHSTDGNVIGKISHSGARQWMVLRPGDNDMDAAASAGSGTVDLIFRPPYA